MRHARYQEGIGLHNLKALRCLGQEEDLGHFKMWMVWEANEWSRFGGGGGALEGGSLWLSGQQLFTVALHATCKRPPPRTFATKLDMFALEAHIQTHVQ